MLAPVTEIFCDMDDFCKDYLKGQSKYFLPNPDRKRDRAMQMSLSEIGTIIVLFQMSHYRTFKDFYCGCVLQDMKKYFPTALSYTRFVACQSAALMMLAAYLLSRKGKHTGLYYIDSTTLRVCHNKRIYRNKVFKGIAKRSKSTMGWVYGFKLHIVINHQGELIRFCLTKGNVDDRAVVRKLMANLKGLGAGDKGYLGKDLADDLAKHDLKFVTKVRKNMKNKMLSAFEKFFLKQRGIVETIIDQLKNLYHVEHSRHRSPINFLVNTLAALIAYSWRPNKPGIKTNNIKNNLYAVIQN
ncbi:IS982 family transposase [Candidiatus Paracoxiella cheracis]|uniref:IS982 family transposase n=1 Tax=Candidiatus Paracoxiella cheracis TaxID=3405120 RepID=UPI003BF589FD